MKRSAALAGLSRDHHQALAVALGLRRATADTAADAVVRFGEYFDRAGDHHFELEETVLLPALPGEGEWAAMADRVRREHRALRAQAETVIAAGANVDPSDARELGDALEAHVRFEERELFPFAEQHLAADELEEIGRRL